MSGRRDLTLAVAVGGVAGLVALGVPLLYAAAVVVALVILL